MKTARIKQIEQDGDTFSVTFKLPSGTYPEDFDLNQLGANIVKISTFGDMAMVLGCELHVGDSITDEEGGEPIIAEVHGKTEQKNFSIVKESDYREAFAQKMSGKGEK